MDAYGARLLAARIRAGVRIGSQIEFTGADALGELGPGDRGMVESIADTGDIVVASGSAASSSRSTRTRPRSSRSLRRSSGRLGPSAGGR